MNKVGIWPIILLLSLIVSYSFSQNNNPQYTLSSGQQDIFFYHTVEQGQTIYGISTMYNVSEEDIYKLNPSSKEYIRVGEKLKIPQAVAFVSTDQLEDTHIFHTIQTGETLYGISKLYKVSVEQIVEANPGMDFKVFASGNTLRIPATQIEKLPTKETQKVTKEVSYKIKKRETIYSLCKKFNITSDKLVAYNPELKTGLKAGMIIKVPVETEETVVTTSEPTEYDINALIAYRNEIQKVNVINIALMLPFESSDIKSVNASRVEYYEGFLLAVDSMRNMGVNIDLSVFDIGDGVQKTKEILKNESLLKSHIIIGGVTNEQIELIAEFASDNHINYVVPFSSKCDKLTSSNPYVFQVNTPYAYLYSYATAKICTLFANYQVIILNTKSDKDDKSLFINTLKADLSHRGVNYKELTFSERSFRTDLTAILSSSKPNLIVPTSGSIEVLTKIKGPLRILAETKTSSQITLLGYPEWQTYSNECIGDFFALNTHIFTSFYANLFSQQVKQFNFKFQRTYRKSITPSYPRYAMLGFDTGFFFMSAINKFGSNFENHIEQFQQESIQSGLEFERVNNWGGFINTNLYIVTFNKDYTITRVKK